MILKKTGKNSREKRHNENKPKTKRSKDTINVGDDGMYCVASAVQAYIFYILSFDYMCVCFCMFLFFCLVLFFAFFPVC